MNRIRQTGHIEGQFTTLIYVPIGDKVKEIFSNHRDDILHIVNEFYKTHESVSSPSMWEFIGNEDLHLSLSRTTLLKAHLVEPFLTRIRKSVTTVSDSCLYLCDTLRLYVNDEGNTAFIGIPIDKSISPTILELISEVDSVLSEFGQKTYYENPDPHVSVAYTTNPLLLSNFPAGSVTQLGRLNLSDAELERFQLDFDNIHVQLGNQTHVV